MKKYITFLLLTISCFANAQNYADYSTTPVFTLRTKTVNGVTYPVWVSGVKYFDPYAVFKPIGYVPTNTEVLNAIGYTPYNGTINLLGFITGNYTGFDGRYLKSFTETDPTVSTFVKGITSSYFDNGNTAFSWGNHAGLYPLLTGSYNNPSWISSLPASKITGLGSAAFNNTGDFFPRPVTFLGNTNISTALSTGVYRNENGAGGNQPYAPVLSLNAGDVGMQLSGGFNTDNFQVRNWYNSGANFTAWRLLWHSGNFDPNGKANTNGAYPSLNVGRSSISGSIDNQANSATIGADINPTPNTIVQRNSSGQSLATYFNTSAPTENVNVDRIFGGYGNDGYIRPISIANIQSSLGLNTAAYQPSSAFYPASNPNSYINLVQAPVQPNGIYSGMTVGNATHATNSDNSINSTYSTTAGTANSVAYTNVAGRFTNLSQFNNDLNLDSHYQPLENQRLSTTNATIFAQQSLVSSIDITQQPTGGQSADLGERFTITDNAHPITYFGQPEIRKISAGEDFRGSYIRFFAGMNYFLDYKGDPFLSFNSSNGAVTISNLLVNNINGNAYNSNNGGLRLAMLTEAGDVTLTYNDYYLVHPEGPGTQTLPVARSGQTFEIANTGTGPITIVVASGGTIGGNASLTMPAGSAYKFFGSDLGNNYYYKY